jgi:signal transduction histidine kinase/ligand-binding sensor domain-containing protein/DNA-binding response OmpR family regulator
MKKLADKVCKEKQVMVAGLLLVFLLVIKTVPGFPTPPITYLGIEHGLSNNTVRCIYQDHRGLMWFGTFDGLNRYDGGNFKVFRNKLNDTGSLVHNIILAITEDSLHNLWIGTRQGISRFEPLLGRFTSIKSLAGKQPPYPALNAVVKDLRADRNNNVFVATEGMGLLLCLPGVQHAQPVPLAQEGGLVTRYSVKNVRVDAANNVWALVQKKGLALYDRRTKQLVLMSEAVPDATWLETAGNSVWIAAGTAIYHYSISTKMLSVVFDGKAALTNTATIVSFSIDKDHRCWITTNVGKLLVWKTSKATAALPGSAENSFSLNGGAIYTVYIDRQSRKWIGTARGGVNIIDPQKGRFRTIAHEPGNNNSLVDNVVAALYEAPDGKLWIGSDGDGLNIWDRSNNRFVLHRHRPEDPASLSDNSITAIKADHAQNIWVATFRKGLNRFNAATQKFERYTLFNTVGKLENRVAYALCEDHDRQLWVSTLRENSVYGALYRFNAAANRFELFDAGLSDLFTLYEDRRGMLWGGNLNQLVKIDRQNKKHTFYPVGHAVRSLHEDGNGHFWIGTEGGGLLLFDRNKQAIAARYTTAQGLGNDVVLTLLEGGKGQLWMSTFNGLSKFDVLKRTFKNYSQDDGLQSNQFHYNSALALRSGELAFGGIKGMSLFDPASITGDHSMPPLLLTDLYINNVPVEQDTRYIRQASADKIESITVPYSKAVFGFRYTALEYAVPGKISYAYYMEGWDRGWNYTGNIHTAAYTHLDEGKYTFRVKSTNEEGEWNAQEIAIRITVLPPWYRSWWAYTLYAAFVLGAIYLFFAYKIRQNRLQYEVKVAHLQAKEAQLAIQQEKEINEKRLSFFTHVSHEFRTPLTLIIDPVKELLAGNKEDAPPEALNMVYRNARRLLSLVDQLLLFRKADSDSDTLRVAELNVSSLCREVFDCFVHQARIKRIDYRFECAHDTILLFADREKLEIMLFNLLSNAIKFTPPGGRVTLQVEETPGTADIHVTDSGYGIPAEVGDQLFNRFYQVKRNQVPAASGFGIGLYLVKHFTTLHHGQISYESSAGKGTSFLLTLQKGHNHFAATEIYHDAQTAPVYLEELAADVESSQPSTGKDLATLVTEKPTILIVDDDPDLRKYVSQVFSKDFNILEAANGRAGLAQAKQYLPDLVISDITMEEPGGMELCRQVKEDPALSHIPIILLTASTASETRLKGIEAGADDYITKPFEKELLKARVVSLLKKRNVLQQYFYNEITLQQNDLKVSVEYREFLQKCIGIVEHHLDDETFSIKTLTMEMGMSRSSLYRKVNSVSGQSIVGFIRFIRLRKAAGLMINTENNVNEIAAMTGFNDIKYFRTHFNQLFGMNPSAYIRKFRKPFHNNLQINKNIIKPE